MSNPTQFRHYLIAQDAGGSNVEVVRSSEQVAVLAFDFQRMCFVHCHVLLEEVQNRPLFDQRGHAVTAFGHSLLARLVEFGDDDGSFFYITENVDGESLTAYLSRLEKLPVWVAMRLSLQAMRAVEACLERGDYLPGTPMDALRVLQTGPLDLSVMLADYRLVEEGGGKAARARIVKSSFEKQWQFLHGFFDEHLAGADPANDRLLGVQDFAEILSKLLLSASPHSLKLLSSYCRTLESSLPKPAAVELAANYKPKPLLASCLASFQEVARSVSQSIRIQSQKLDVSQPYAMRGTLMKTGQSVYVEQVVSRSLGGLRPSEAVHQVQALPKAGKFPNLVPIVFVEENDGIECMAETAVEGVSLSELLAARGSLQSEEVYLVLAGLDTALGQTEKAGIGSRRIRLEDIFLFTGFGKENPRDGGLLGTKLHDWPGFSIVLRAHPCLHGMACRGTDPALLLPIEVHARPDVELFWNGGWMAALGGLLIGISTALTHRKTATDKTGEGVARMLEDELDKAKRSNPSSRAAFLARYARVLQQHDLARFDGGPWQELSGSPSAQGHAMEVARAVQAESPPKPALRKLGKASSASLATPVVAATLGALAQSSSDPPEEKSDIGFAELLMAGPMAENEALHHGGLRRMVATGDEEDISGYESSWSTLHEEAPLWMTIVMVVIGSLILGALMAQLSGHAIWQVRNPARHALPPGTSATQGQEGNAEAEKEDAGSPLPSGGRYSHTYKEETAGKDPTTAPPQAQPSAPALRLSPVDSKVPSLPVPHFIEGPTDAELRLPTIRKATPPSSGEAPPPRAQPVDPPNPAK